MNTLMNIKSSTIRDAAAATGENETILRAWLYTGEAHVFSAKGDNWAKLFGADIALLSLAAPMIRFGIAAGPALKIARWIVTRNFSLGEHIGSDASDLAGALGETCFRVSRDGRCALMVEPNTDAGDPRSLTIRAGDCLRQSFARLEAAPA